MILLINTAKMQTIGQCTKIHRPIGRFSSTHGIANKGVIALRSSVVRSNFCKGGQERSPQSLTSHTARTLYTSVSERTLSFENLTF
jgi:hypothetical protein